MSDRIFEYLICFGIYRRSDGVIYRGAAAYRHLLNSNDNL